MIHNQIKSSPGTAIVLLPQKIIRDRIKSSPGTANKLNLWNDVGVAEGFHLLWMDGNILIIFGMMDGEVFVYYGWMMHKDIPWNVIHVRIHSTVRVIRLNKIESSYRDQSPSTIKMICDQIESSPGKAIVFLPQ
jgi:hypothetical protein